MAECLCYLWRIHKPPHLAHRHADATTQWGTATTDAKNASVFGPHFHKVFNNHRPIDCPVLYKIKKIEVMDELDQPISWGEIKKPTTKLSNNKAPGINGVPPNAFKALENANLSWILLLYNQFFNSQSDFNEWYEGQVVTVSRKVDTIDPNNLREVTLMDIGNKI